MNASEKDYYKILGIIDSAELAVIKSVYKTLMQLYHPDKYKGDAKDADLKSKQINEAYAVLVDPAKRNKYDIMRLATKNKFELESEDKEHLKATNDLLKAEWDIALEYVKDLNNLYEGLLVLSQNLALTFKLEILETKRFHQATYIAKQFELGFLKKFFGTNKKIQDFSFWLIKQGRRDIARELNKVVLVLGTDIVANNVIGVLVEKYHLHEYKISCFGDIQSKYRPLKENIKAIKLYQCRSSNHEN